MFTNNIIDYCLICDSNYTRLNKIKKIFPEIFLENSWTTMFIEWFCKNFSGVMLSCIYTVHIWKKSNKYSFITIRAQLVACLAGLFLLSDSDSASTPGVSCLYSLMSGWSWLHYLSFKVLIGLQQWGEVRKLMGRVCGMKLFIPSSVSTLTTNHSFLG